MKTKRTVIQKFLLLGVILCLPLAGHAQFTFTTNNGAIIITGYSGSGLANIPAMTNGHPVTTINYEAFYNNAGITGVIIPSSVTNIGQQAFQACSFLTNATILGGSIGNDAFQGCPQLTSVTIGSGVTSVGVSAFLSCSSLTDVIITNGVAVIGNEAFSGIRLTSITIPGSVTNMGQQTFEACSYLTNATILGGSIGDTAFGLCMRLTSVMIGSGVTSIGPDAFEACSSLTNLVITNGLGSISNYAFSDTHLANVTIPNSVTNLGTGGFDDCASLTSATLGTGITSLGTNEFDQCSSLTNLVFLGALIAIGDTALAQTHLAAFTIPGTVNRIGSGAFASTLLTNVTIPASVTNIGAGPFQGCARLKAITVDPANLNYSSLSGVLFDKDQDTIVQYPGGVSGSYVLPASVTTIAESAFNDCMALTGITLSPNVTSIEGSAFEYCTSLAGITIPDSVTNIGDLAFYNCSLIPSVVIPPGVPAIGVEVFCSCSSLTNVVIPNGVTSIGADAFSSCNIATFTIPASVTNLGIDVFYWFSAPNAVYFMGNAPENYADAFYGVSPIVYYLPGMAGWDDFATNTGLTTVPWLPQIQSDASFGVRTNQFGFNINWAGGQTVVVQACTNLLNPVWLPIQTNFLTSGSAWFGDPQWTNYSGRFYRVNSQ